MRLIDHLKQTGMSNREARAALQSGKVWIDGIPTADAGRDVQPEHVDFRASSPRIQVGRDAVVLFRDDHLAVVYKPAGMLSVPAPRRKDTNVLAEVGRTLGSVHAVHRLDEGTSGVMLVARSVSCQKQLKDLFETHTIERVYLALVGGKLPEASMRVESNLVRDRGDGKRGTGEGEGKNAITQLERIRQAKSIGLVKATLETGRTHQVRIHCAEKGCAVLGDPLYARPGDARRAPRLALHAHVLGFIHPVTKKTLRFEAPLADDLAQIWRDAVADKGHLAPTKPPANRSAKKARKKKKHKR